MVNHSPRDFIVAKVVQGDKEIIRIEGSGEGFSRVSLGSKRPSPSGQGVLADLMEYGMKAFSLGALLTSGTKK